MATRTMLHDLIGQEVAAGIAPGRVLIGGFSQGAAMACFAALTFDQPLAGCFMLSGYLTLKGKVPGMVTAGAKQTPFWHWEESLRHLKSASRLSASVQAQRPCS